MKQRAIDVNAVALRGDNVVLGNELQVLRFAPAFQQILERLTQDALATSARYLPQPVEIGAVFVDKLTAHLIPLLGGPALSYIIDQGTT